MQKREDIRNIAIIAHVDHGKTTLVDQMLAQSGIFRQNEQVAERVMDSNDLERERGITILSKNTGVHYNGVKINIVDTPGHADFGGEVERILMMVDGVLLLVDAFEGCMPQTRFVLKKALALGKKAIVVVNKIDRPGARPAEVVDEVIDLFIELDAEEDQLEFPVVYASGRDGTSGLSPDDMKEDLRPLFDTILKEIPAPDCDREAPLKALISNIDYDEYVGRIGVGRVEQGELKVGQQVVLCRKDSDAVTKAKIIKLYTFEGLKRAEVQVAGPGDLVSIAGVTAINIGDTICDPEHPDPMPFVKIDEPTVSMNFMVNNISFCRAKRANLSPREISATAFSRRLKPMSASRWRKPIRPILSRCPGRGELHLSILIETMRRQGYEFQVSRPKVIYKTGENGERLEPIELLMVEVPEAYVGPVMEKLGARKAEMVNMGTRDGGMTHIEFRIPARCLMGYRPQFLTATNGNGIMNHVFDCFEPYKGDVEERESGSIVSFETGETSAYGLYNTQDRGRLFVGPGVEVYEGMIVGESPKGDDIVCNVCKKKHLTNTRASGSDDALRLVPPVNMSLEQCLEFLKDDEYLEVTPESLRLRKSILNKEQRLKAENRKNNG